MIEEPAWTGGKRISPKPARGPEDSRRRSLQIFDSFTAIRLRTPENRTKAPISDVASMRLVASTIGLPEACASSSTASDA